ncbi:OCIA domain-containing protein 2 isoform X2 [Narcine bancroftii]|uniref:OCIA domain-containing protein 2 isoform X2 n=1 Tax=Narcine bancroftii TaxID=1343680 RepID=UPI003831CB87
MSSPTAPRQNQQKPPCKGDGYTWHFGDQNTARIIMECKRESFWFRGVLSPSKRFGSVPKVALAGILGFVIGKISYMGACRKKFESAGFEHFGKKLPPGYMRFLFGQPYYESEHCKGKDGPHQHTDDSNKSEQPTPATGDSSSKNA